MNYKTFDEYIDSLKSAKSFVGGGSANGVVAKLAVALVLKSLNVSANRKSFKNLDKKEQKSHLDSIKFLEKSLKEYDKLSNEDEKAFSMFMDVYKTKDQKKISKAAEKCYLVPYSLFEQLEKDIKVILKEEKFVVSSIISDYKMGLSLFKSALESSLFNLEINVGLLDKTFEKKYKTTPYDIEFLIDQISIVLRGI